MANAVDSPAPVPSGAEVVAQLHAQMENDALQKTTNVIEDRRYPVGAVPVEQRSYMNPPRMRDYLR